MQRTTKLVSGWDCVRNPCPHPTPCEGSPGKTHGFHGDEWRYLVTDDESPAIVLELIVCTDMYPESVPAEHIDMVWGASMARRICLVMDLHIDCQSDDDDGVCDSLDDERCHGRHLEGAVPKEFFSRHGSCEDIEQPESFWIEVEGLYRVLVEGYYSSLPN